MLRRTLLSAALLLGVVTGWTTAAVDQGEETRNTAGSSKDASSAATSAKTAAELKEAEGRPAVPRNPRVLFITKKGCERCARDLTRLRRPNGDFAGMQAVGWKIGEGPENHLQIVDREAVPDFVVQLEIKEYPTVVCISDGEIVRSFKEGCTTPLDAWTFGFLLKGKDERPPGSIPEAARVESTGSYRLRGNHWSVDGDWNPTRATVISHLRGPNHGSQVAAGYEIEKWSYEELRSLHDDLHEKYPDGGAVYNGGSSSDSGNSNPATSYRKFKG